MTNTSTNPMLTGLEAQVEKMLTLAISSFQNLPADVLTRASATGGWSIAQCLWHVNSYGHYYLPRLAKVMASPVRSSDNFRSGWLGAYFTAAMKEEAKKMKAFKNHTPPSEPNDAREVAEFIHQLEQLTVLLQKAHQADLNTRLPISLTRLIRLKLGDVLQFYVAHLQRHVNQALRNVPA